MNIAGRFGTDALRALREVPGLVVTVGGGPDEADAILRFAGSSVLVAVEAKARVDAGAAWKVVRRAERHDDLPLLLVAGETTADARRILEAHAVALVDGLGHAHIELPGLLVHLEPRRSPPRAAGPPGRRLLRGKAGVAAQALLLQPERAWQVQELASTAEVSASLAHSVLRRLEDDGIVAAEGRGPNRVRRVVDATALLDLWAEENVDRPRRALGHVLATTPHQLLERVATGLEQAGVEHALTGPAGASLVAPFVSSIPIIDVWVTAAAALEELYEATDAAPVSDGHNVVFLQAKDDTPLVFRDHVTPAWVANRFRIYVDLLRDPRRGREQAEHLREEVIRF